jgi:hypothetical protein
VTPAPHGTAALAGGGRRPAAAPNPWSAQAAYHIPISQEALAQQNGLLYSFGGFSNRATVSNAYKYNPATNSWTDLRSMLVGLSQASAVSNGTAIYIINGSYHNSLYRYDPLTDNYTQLASPTVATAGQAAVYLNGQIYRIGGFLNRTTPTSSVEVYTIATNTWALGPAYPQAVGWIMAVAARGAIYTAGGDDSRSVGTAKTYRYSPAGGGWDDAAVRDLPAARWRGATDMVAGRWLLAGGIEVSGYSSRVLAWNLDPAAPWVDLPSMLQARYSTAGAGSGLAFYTVGGCGPLGCNSGTTNTQRYDTFTDVQLGDYFYTPVLYLVTQGIVSGYADGTFRPSANTTRGQLAKLIVLGEGWAPNTTGGPHFTDVPPSYVFYSVIETAVNHGIVSGYADGTFRPGADVTRGQLSKIIVAAQGWPFNTSGGPHFTDVPPASPFYPFVETAVNHGIISGYADGTFRPANNATRGQIAKIVYNALLNGATPTATPPLPTATRPPPVTRTPPVATSTPTRPPANTPTNTPARTPTRTRTPTPTPTCPPPVPVNFALDDGSYERALTGNDATTEYAALWLNRFTPAAGSYPLTLTSLSILWPSVLNTQLVGKTARLLVYLDADGNNNPSNATLLSQQFVTINMLDAFQQYQVNIPVAGPTGDLYIGFEDYWAEPGYTPAQFPAAQDIDASQLRSWFVYRTGGLPPNIIDLSANDVLGIIDNFQYPGNWLIRATGTSATCGTLDLKEP